MVKILTKVVVGVFMFALLASPAAHAWSTRVITLGHQNRFIQDDANVWIYPQKTVNYANRLYLDLNHLSNHTGDADDYFFIDNPAIMQSTGAGGFLALTDSLALGVWLSDFEDNTSQRFLRWANAVQQSGGLDGGVFSDQAIAPENLSDRVRTGESARPSRFDSTQNHPTSEEFSNRKVDVFMGLDLGTLSLGAQLAVGRASVNRVNEVITDHSLTTSNLIRYETQQILLGLGSSLAFSPDAILDMAFQFNRRDLSWSEQYDYMSFDGGNSINVDSRFRMRVSKNWWVTPAIGLKYDSFSAYVDRARGSGDALSSRDANWMTDIDMSNLNFDLGVGGHMKLEDRLNLFVATGLQIESTSIEAFSSEGFREISMNTYQLPYFKGGFEGALFDWVTLRAGFAKFVAWQSFIDDAEQYRKNALNRDRLVLVNEWDMSLSPSTGHRTFYTFIGAGTEHRGWKFDVQIDPFLLYSGPSDNNEGGYPWFNRITIGYVW